MMKFEELEQQFSIAIDDWLNSKLGVLKKWINPLLHYTDADAAKSIVEYQRFHASFIRSTSDPLEFVLPLSEVRDWVCTNGNLFYNFDRPDNLFKHFNELSENPDSRIRPYFISMVKKPSDHLKKQYGGTAIELRESNEANTIIPGLLIPIAYPENIETHVSLLMKDWQRTVLHKVRERFSAVPERTYVDTTFHLWMKAFIVTALSVKKSAYKNEDEVRLVVLPGRPDQSTSQCDSRVIIPSDKEPGLPRREYLPVKLSELGLRAKLLKD
jgi:hypothetical protein